MTREAHSNDSILSNKVVVTSRPQSQTHSRRELASSGEDRKGQMPARALDAQCINTIRTLAMDAVQQANSGHPGTPMALAPVAYTLWQNFLRFDPDDPLWPNRDRFVLSNGHSSMLLYALLHLAGVKAVNTQYEYLDEPAVTLDDITRFRQLGSKCPGHPEYHLTSGVETTTGPLGQGCCCSRKTTVRLARDFTPDAATDAHRGHWAHLRTA